MEEDAEFSAFAETSAKADKPLIESLGLRGEEVVTDA